MFNESLILISYIYIYIYIYINTHTHTHTHTHICEAWCFLWGHMLLDYKFGFDLLGVTSS